MRRLKLCCLLGLLLQAPFASADLAWLEDHEPKPLATAASAHRTEVGFVKTAFGDKRSERILSTAERLWPEFKVAAACLGSFNVPGHQEAALALVKADASQVVYAVFLNDTQPVVLLDQKVDSSAPAAAQRMVGIRCRSWTSIERKNAALRQPGQSAGVTRNTLMDSACVMPLDADQPVACYGYDRKRQEFAKLGSWPKE